jgi:hypothetical protein
MKYFLMSVGAALTLLPLAEHDSAGAQAETGMVSGYVFHDLDRDGVRDSGEPGLVSIVQVFNSDTLAGDVLSNTEGAYVIEGIAPGDYTLGTELDGAASFCLTPAFPSFHPLLLAGCFGDVPEPWHNTTPEQFPITIEGGGSYQFDIGGYPFDQSVLMGHAILEDNYAAPGTPIQAFVNGQLCGETASNGRGQPDFEITILGAGEQAGCAMPGQELRFVIGGLDAAETPAYTPQIEQIDPGRFLQNLTAMNNYAWYWLIQPSEQLPPAGSLVQALIGDTVCGETVLESQSWASGFYRLAVRSDAVQPGCARPGARVSFLVGGVRAVNTVDWRTGVQQIELQMPATPTPAPTEAPPGAPTVLPSSGAPARLPGTGGRP